MNYYLKNYSVRSQLIAENPSDKIGVIVVIPCFNEPKLNKSLQSLFDCKLPDCEVEVIVVINASKKAEGFVLNQNKKTLLDAEEWRTANFGKIASSRKLSGLAMTFHFIQENELPIKDAGVGLARKIGMDEAVRRFEQINKPDGVIVCFDADSKCEENYLVEIEKHFKANPKSPACSIHFEHPIEGKDYPEHIYKGIAEYELHLRYYKNGLNYCGLPYAYHTIGSSMAVRSSAYQKQNGMNKRKAGEDFYFLQKLIPLGDFTEIKTTTVIPSPRISDRVPFGTGKAMQNYVDNEQKEHLSYNMLSFIDLKQFCTVVPELYNTDKVEIPKSVKAYLEEINFEANLQKIIKNSPTQAHFIKSFYNWFNAFRVLKYMHFARDNYYSDVFVTQAANDFLKLTNHKEKESLKALLLTFREIDLN